MGRGPKGKCVHAAIINAMNFLARRDSALHLSTLLDKVKTLIQSIGNLQRILHKISKHFNFRKIKDENFRKAKLT